MKKNKVTISKKAEAQAEKNWINFFAEEKMLVRLAKEKLLKEGHPSFYIVGRGAGRKIQIEHDKNNLVDRKVVLDMWDAELEILRKFETVYGRWNMSMQDVMEKL